MLLPQNEECKEADVSDIFLKDSVPESCYSLSIEELEKRITKLKRELGEKLLIVCHHYQRDEVFQFADVSGDSLILSQQAASHKQAQYIIFCGVHFMAETADILTNDSQSVILPNLTAGCSMADMADLDDVEEAWDSMAAVLGEENMIPITYINSDAKLKAFCGEHGGTVCTSSNAPKILSWALDQGKRVFFFPDEHLGRNTANRLGVPGSEIFLWKRKKPMGGLSDADLKKGKVFLWDGFCSVHMRFKPDQIQYYRENYPGIKIIVHPECREDTVNLADDAGSTEYILRTIKNSPPGTKWAVGTEVNLVNRMNKTLADHDVFCLDPIVCPCSTMFRTHPANLYWIMEQLVQNKVHNTIKVPKEVASKAIVALNRMLELS